MFDVSASELLVIGAVALIVIGPKELPGVLRMVGQTVGKLKRMAGDFRNQFDEAMREADLHDIQKTVSDAQSSVSSFNPLNTIRNELSSTVNELKSTRATEVRAADVAASPVSADIAVAGEQGPPVMTLDSVPEPAPMRLAPEVPTPETPTVLRVAADPVEADAEDAARKPRRKAVKKPAGEGA